MTEESDYFIKSFWNMIQIKLKQLALAVIDIFTIICN